MSDSNQWVPRSVSVTPDTSSSGCHVMNKEEPSAQVKDGIRALIACGQCHQPCGADFITSHRLNCAGSIANLCRERAAGSGSVFIYYSPPGACQRRIYAGLTPPCGAGELRLTRLGRKHSFPSCLDLKPPLRLCLLEVEV